MKIQCSHKENTRNRVFPLKISRKEAESLRIESQKQKISMAALVREGYLSKTKPVSLYSRF